MEHKFVFRLLSDNHYMLGWASVMIRPQPGGRFVTQNTSFLVTAAGTATKIAIHWTDLDISRLEKLLEPVVIPESHIGKEAKMFWLNPIWLVKGEEGVPKHTIEEVTPVVLQPATGGIGAVGNV